MGPAAWTETHRSSLCENCRRDIRYAVLAESCSRTITRRKFLQASLSATGAAPLFTSAGENATGGAPQSTATPIDYRLAAPAKLKRKPNIVVAVLDDVGFSDLGCYGAEYATRPASTIWPQPARDSTTFMSPRFVHRPGPAC